MKKIVLCLSLLLIASSLGVAKDKDKDKNSKDNSATDQKLIDLEKSMWEAWKNQDRKPFDENLAPNFVGVDSGGMNDKTRSEEHTSELQSRFDLVCRLLLEKKK